MNKYSELKNFIDNFVEKVNHHLVKTNNKKTLKKIDNDKEVLIKQIEEIF